MNLTLPAGHLKASNLKLCDDHEVSTIPRVNLEAENSEHYSQYQDPWGGNWIYQLGEMFFNAIKRKDRNPRAEDMRTIVSINNAINKRVRQRGRGLSDGRLANTCLCLGGRKLIPKARFLVLLGRTCYHAPFTRHYCTVDRCRKIDYVIDFYRGKPNPKGAGELSFYQDLCPKLPPVGAWMRMQ
ncbi:hypothetical protein C7212DRAFT_184875 [Tuber magnatum]|uniref:Holocytochrome c-type synthase n=1 Tax=Tuber magnatum TaxID=42249 RepID=A0A317SRY7_9PEZI|nr:hypothetical protein C7212DRAFT_184875 [Tuber magnatum]